MGESRFSSVEIAPPIEVFTLTAKFKEDDYPDKVDLGIGAYRDESGQPLVLPVVKGVEQIISEDASLNHEYLPVLGLPAFRDAASELLLGKNCSSIVENRVVSAQTLGGTGSLRLAAEFCRQHLKADTVYISNPSWNNHQGVFHAAGYNIKKYRYWAAESRSIDLAGMCEDIEQASSLSVVLLHACAHNPTGVDPTRDQWQTIAESCQKSGAIVLLDIAYQGFSSGDLDQDAFSVRLFERMGFEFFISQSFSKNFGLYNERVGNLAIVTSSAQVKSAIQSQLELIVRRMWSNPPNHGGRVVATVLCNPALYSEWKNTVKSMADRILLMRKMLFEKLVALGTPGTWNHIIEQTGMFSYTGLNVNQVSYLLRKYHIYVMKSGRINMCGLTTMNLDYVGQAIHDAVLNAPHDYGV